MAHQCEGSAMFLSHKTRLANADTVFARGSATE